MWDFYEVEIEVHRLVAGLPGNPKALNAWLERNRAPIEALPEMQAMQERLEPEETQMMVFYRNPDGVPCFEARNLKAALKEAANILGSSQKRTGILRTLNLRSKLAERVFVAHRYNGGVEYDLMPIKTSIQAASRPISVITPQGPRTSIKHFEYAENVHLNFELKILQDHLVSDSDVKACLDYLQDAGVGADRAQGAGQFKLLKFEKKN
jgi:hypothetical protein